MICDVAPRVNPLMHRGAAARALRACKSAQLCRWGGRDIRPAPLALSVPSNTSITLQCAIGATEASLRAPPDHGHHHLPPQNQLGCSPGPPIKNRNILIKASMHVRWPNSQPFARLAGLQATAKTAKKTVDVGGLAVKSCILTDKMFHDWWIAQAGFVRRGVWRAVMMVGGTRRQKCGSQRLPHTHLPQTVSLSSPSPTPVGTQ